MAFNCSGVNNLGISSNLPSLAKIPACAGQIQEADLLLLGAMGTAAISYAEGGCLAQILGGWQVICWALVIAFPILLIPVTYTVFQYGLVASPTAWLGFSYVSIFS